MNNTSQIRTLESVSEFISEAPSLVPPRTVQVQDATGVVKDTYIIPAGFQLEMYLMSLFGEHDSGECHYDRKTKITIIEIKRDGILYEKHIAKFNYPIDHQ